jgi:hypothetical protein
MGILNLCNVFVVGAHIVMWISLFMKRGAMAVGYVVTLAGYWLVSTIFFLFFASLGSPSRRYPTLEIIALAPIAILVFFLALTWFLFRLIPYRLERLAGEG